MEMTPLVLLVALVLSMKVAAGTASSSSSSSGQSATTGVPDYYLVNLLNGLTPSPIFIIFSNYDVAMFCVQIVLMFVFGIIVPIILTIVYGVVNFFIKREKTKRANVL